MTFTWDDGVQDVYSSALWVPTDVQEPQEIRGRVLPTLDLGAVLVTQERDGSADRRAPRSYKLIWEVADPEFLPVAEATYAACRRVTCAIPNRIDADAGERWTAKEITGYIVPGGFEARGLDGRLTALEITIAEVRAA